MSIISKLKKSRDNWKEKAKLRAELIRYFKKEKNRIKAERDKYKKMFQEAEEELEKERQKNTLPVQNKADIVYIALMLFIIAKIGFRAVSRVLEVLADYLGIKKAPSPQTVSNWVTRLSIARTRNFIPPGCQTGAAPFSNGLIYMIDISIGLGSGKILAVLGLNAGHYASHNTAPNLQQVSCIAVSVAATWTGETIADFLQKVIAVTGRPAAWLKDRGADLAKGLRILDEKGISSPSIDDISHISANLLKHEYENHPMFNTFISACGKASKNLKQTILACLAPPKISTKARFMNIHRLLNWAEKLLKHSPRGRASEGSILSKLRKCIDIIPKCKNFIQNFLRDANCLLECQKVLKNQGLNNETYMECKELLEKLPAKSHVRQGLLLWMDKHLETARELGLENKGLPITSDTIESLFGVSKQHGTGQIKDVNRIALRIPALCGGLTKADAKMVLNISVKEHQEIVGALPSLTKQRREILPNPGSLDKILIHEKEQNFELIPRAKNRSKNLINLDFTECCNNPHAPKMAQKNVQNHLPKPSCQRHSQDRFFLSAWWVQKVVKGFYGI